MLRGLGVHGDLGRPVLRIGPASLGAEAQLHLGLLGTGGELGVLRMLTVLVTLGGT